MTYKEVLDFWETKKPIRSGKTLWLMIAKAIEKQISVVPIYSDYDDNGAGELIPCTANCPVCGHEFEFGDWNEWENPYCKCGQKMDWGEY